MIICILILVCAILFAKIARQSQAISISKVSRMPIIFAGDLWERHVGSRAPGIETISFYLSAASTWAQNWTQSWTHSCMIPCTTNHCTAPSTQGKRYWSLTWFQGASTSCLSSVFLYENCAFLVDAMLQVELQWPAAGATAPSRPTPKGMTLKTTPCSSAAQVWTCLSVLSINQLCLVLIVLYVEHFFFDHLMSNLCQEARAADGDLWDGL